MFMFTNRSGGDSQVAALVPQCEVGVPLGDRYRDRQSVIMTQALRKIHYSVASSRTLIVFLNQVREVL